MCLTCDIRPPAGQFQRADVSLVKVTDVDASAPEGILAWGSLRKGSEHIPVTLQDKMLKDTVLKRHSDQCWVVPKAELERLLGHPYQSYVVDQVQSS